jgi:hypothetical protein
MVKQIGTKKITDHFMAEVEYFCGRQTRGGTGPGQAENRDQLPGERGG